MRRQRHSDDNNQDLQRQQEEEEQQLQNQRRQHEEEEQQLQDQRRQQRLEEILRQRQVQRQEQQLVNQRRQQRLEELKRQQEQRQDQELEEHRQRQRLVEQRRQQQQHAEDEEDQRIIDPVHVRGEIYVSSLSYTEAFRQYKPSKFITVMSHAIWGYRNLALRGVKITKRNQNIKLLTPEKKVVLEHQYHRFLKKRNLSNEMVIMERNNINTYLGRSITSAEKKAIGSR
ncbi:putative uncharacterized protein DDB_G0271606 [Microplitis mediator]|uniref:putative uncharacterized protein DDB_G0271606 n=1 Tax=Microplitis mediator TaxID=375433 RepID=UPI002553E7F0|nr:putative uncharacterized protein DDB_G0271606 [Microplitis mediator]